MHQFVINSSVKYQHQYVCVLTQTLANEGAEFSQGHGFIRFVLNWTLLAAALQGAPSCPGHQKSIGPFGGGTMAVDP